MTMSAVTQMPSHRTRQARQCARDDTGCKLSGRQERVTEGWSGLQALGMLDDAFLTHALFQVTRINATITVKEGQTRA